MFVGNRATVSETCLTTNRQQSNSQCIGTIPTFGKRDKKHPRTANSCSSICCQRKIIKNTGFHNLDDNILILIFSYFATKELFAILSKVCRDWRKVALSPQLCKHLEFKGQKIDTNSICCLLRRSQYLESLVLEDVKDAVSVIRQMCRCNKLLRHLTLRYCKPNWAEKMPGTVLRNILHSCLNLETLNLEGTQFSSKRFYQELVNLTHLKNLNLSENQYLCVKNLLTVSLNCRELEDISIISTKNKNLCIPNADAVFFFNNLSRNLKRIECDASAFSTPAYEAILTSCQLEKLILHNALGLLGRTLRENVFSLKNLKELSLTRAINLTSDDLLYLSKSYALNMLQKLDLSGCWKICNIDLQIILQCCREHLVYLRLKSCKLINDINFIIDNCSQLEYLNIAYTIYPSKETLMKFPSSLKKLCTLVMHRKYPQDNNLITLSMHMPQLNIIYCLSEFHDM